ncbi:hypothetical protein [Nocardiopsis sp. MG754419]|uniref:hypothetical protein n=1 Tax=Nocardiopsis sp. MG754419 TaxID=2259865 RepID=UPI001BAD72A9|nr:hypothetical protein [Nocardiopsis sp. MG754419]MBR8743149.1 hypothetical protein [Nocardiopsis sp. MG754419]
MNDRSEDLQTLIISGCLVVLGVPLVVLIWVCDDRFSWMGCLGILTGVLTLPGPVRRYRARSGKRRPQATPPSEGDSDP